VLYVTQDYREAMALGDRIAVLRGGRIEQLASPAEIYQGPDSVEIARLFGDPTINLYPCRPERGDSGPRVSLFGRSFPLPDALGHASGRGCLVGLRPENVRVSAEAVADAAVFELDAVMPLNVRSVLYLRAPGGEELLATVGEDAVSRFGRGHRRVWVDIAPEHLLVFDGETRARIAPRAS
jgi:multiple sugar transport system ATP-binding protein